MDLAELEQLLDDVLTTTKLALDERRAAEPELMLHKESLASGTIAERSVERFRAQHPTRPVELSVDPSAPKIEADPILLRRVLDNLLENAHKYSPEPTTAISLDVSTHDGRARFVVTDRGEGIAKDDLVHVFDPFFRADRSRTRGTGGVGLGLTLAKRITMAHGGTIAIESPAVDGRGTRVEISLPIA